MMVSSKSAAAGKRRRGVRVRAKVINCMIPSAPQGDTFSRRRTMFCSLTCGHVQQKRSYRRFLVGEAIDCEICTAAAHTAQPAFEGMF
jgi:hypothetical protein